ncbi:MAG: transcriptional regulator [Candidatus Marinimicrobia bacterium]|nr:transcriptional regulator [Candidatus Neomarinimicrobiota bacterium]
MAQLTRDYRETIQNRLKKDPEFAKHLLDEAVSEFLNDNPESARILLREIVNATIGFEQLAKKTSNNSKSLHRMLSARGNPSMNNLTNIFGVLKQNLNVNFEIHAVSKAG